MHAVPAHECEADMLNVRVPRNVDDEVTAAQVDAAGPVFDS
jgi:hypothetical protein